MGATRNTGYLENLIQYDASDNVAIATSVNPSYKVTLGGPVITTGSITASSAIARGGLIGTTLIASANNDVLVGLDINPTFTNGAFTGVTNYGIRYNSSNAITPFYFQSTSSGTAYTTNTIGGNNTFTIASRDILTTNFVLLNGSNGVNLYTYNNSLTLDRIGTNNFFKIINQNVAIGTTTDSGYKLDVSGTARVSGAATFSSSVTATQFIQTSDSSTELKIGRYNSTFQNAYIDAYHSSGSVGMHLRTQDAGSLYSRIVITSGGNVGIGTTSPNYLLHINSSTTSSVLQLTNSTTGSAANRGARLFISGLDVILNNREAGMVSFETQDTERMRITSGGDMLFATGRTIGVNTSDGTDTSFLLISGGSAASPGRGAGLVINGNDRTTYGGQLDLFTGDSATSYMTFSIGSGEKMRITNGGNVYIGTTSDATGAGFVANTGRVKLGDGGGFELNFNTSTYTAFQLASSEKMRITSGGNVAINNNLAVGRAEELGVRLSVTSSGTSSAAYSIICRDSSGNDLFVLRNDGYMLTGTRAFSPYNNTSGVAANMVVGADGTLYRSTSSLKYKTNVKAYNRGLNEVMQLNPVYYNSKNEKEQGIQFAGLIAEEVHELGLTEFVQYAEDGSPDALAYQNMVALLTKAIQELKAELDILKNR